MGIHRPALSDSYKLSDFHQCNDRYIDMTKYTANADNTASVSSINTLFNQGTTYRASGSLFIAKQTTRSIPKHFVNTSRSTIVGFSAGSAVRMRRYLRECRPDYTKMVTLTYPNGFNIDGTEHKNHLRRFLQEIQREYKRRFEKQLELEFDEETEKYIKPRTKHSAFWFLEFQKRGAPHFHIFLNWSPDKYWISKKWFDIVGSDDPSHALAGTRVEVLKRGRAGTISYASKYAAKAEQKVVPDQYLNVGRFWGIYGDRLTMAATTWLSRADALNPNIKKCEETMLKQVKKDIEEGKAEVLKREEGVLIVVYSNMQAMSRVKLRLNNLTMHTQVVSDYFQDAEVDYGEIYNDERWNMTQGTRNHAT